MNNKKLYRSNTDKQVMGVCGGLGDYFEIDSTLVRLAFVALVLFADTGLLAYLLAYLIMGIVIPKEDEINNNRNHSQNTDDKTENNIDKTEDYYEQMSFLDDENL